jgi:hypothetical protein
MPGKARTPAVPDARKAGTTSRVGEKILEILPFGEHTINL